MWLMREAKEGVTAHTIAHISRTKRHRDMLDMCKEMIKTGSLVVEQKTTRIN